MYNGKENNPELGLIWLSFGFREYDPTIGRFPSVDPIADQFAHVSGFNYAENDPVGHIDLWGLQKGDPPTPSAAGILYEAWVNLDAAFYNSFMRTAELKGVRKPGVISRKVVQYGPNGEILGPNKIVEKPINSPSQELKETFFDLLSFSVLLGPEKNAMGPMLMTKAPSSIIPAIAKQFDNLKCIECAEAVVKALKKEGLSGEVIDFHPTRNGKKYSTPVHSDKASDRISNSGLHRGVLIEGKVYDNIHTEGIDIDGWIKDKHHFGDGHIIETVKKF